MNTDDLLAKRANAQRIKDFARQLKDFNKITQDPTKRTLEGEKARQLEIARNFQESKVAKAAEFAKHVPKPKSVLNKGVKSNLGSLKSNPVSGELSSVSAIRDSSTTNMSSVYREKYLTQGTRQRYEPSECFDSRIGEYDDDDDENQSNQYIHSTNRTTFLSGPCDNLPTRLEILESKYRESQRQVESIKQQFRK